MCKHYFPVNMKHMYSENLIRAANTRSTRTKHESGTTHSFDFIRTKISVLGLQLYF